MKTTPFLFRSIYVLVLPCAVELSLAQPAPIHDPYACGAKGDGKTNDRLALQRAIDACKSSGGSVFLHDGVFLSGQITLGSDMTLFIAPSATLLGIQSTNQDDYPSKAASVENHINTTCQRRLIWGEGLTNIAITGGGTLDGQGDFRPWRNVNGKIPERLRPSLIEIAGSEKVEVSDLTLLRPGTWTQVYLQCTNLVLRKLRVDTGNLAGNRDGMDICDCHQALIEDCDIKAQDDGICFKSGNAVGCEDIVVRRCRVDKLGVSAGNCVKFGTASRGSFRNVLCHNLVVRNTGNTAFSWESVDGAVIENVQVRDCQVSNAAQVISLMLGDRSGLGERIGSISHVDFQNIRSSSGTRPIGCLVTGAPGHPLRDIRFTHLQLQFPGGPTELPPPPKEYQGGYPEGTYFGNLPGYAFYVRHAEGVVFADCDFSTDAPDARRWLETEDVRDLKCQNLKVAAPRRRL